MGEAFTLDEWLAFVDDEDAFDVKITGQVSNERVVIQCEDGIEIFNRELWDIVIELMNYNESWVETYAEDIVRHRAKC